VSAKIINGKAFAERLSGRIVLAISTFRVARHWSSHFLVDEPKDRERRFNRIDPDKDACILFNASSFQNI
jgi:hypothetical protein